MTSKNTFRHIDIQALHRLSDIFQKEVSTLVAYYLKDSKKLMEKLQKYFLNKDAAEICTTARELRENSQEIGALKFSFLMLGLEITAQEYRIYPCESLYHLIEENYNLVAQELNDLCRPQPPYPG